MSIDTSPCVYTFGLNLSSHLTLWVIFPPLSDNLLLAVILSPLSITDVPSRHRDIHTACLQQGHKEPSLHQYSHISPLYCAANHTLAAREASDRGCVTVLVANSPELSGSKELFNFPVYLRRQQCNKLITEICTVCACMRVCVPSCMHACQCTVDPLILRLNVILDLLG